MRSFLSCGITVASALLIQPVPASAQRVHGVGHPHIAHGYAGHGSARFRYQHGGYAGGYGSGYGLGAGVAALATGALIGGAIANQNQGYYPAQTYSGYSDPSYVYGAAAPAPYDYGDAVAYCQRTYRSYDPARGSYLGYDGVRYACP